MPEEKKQLPPDGENKPEITLTDVANQQEKKEEKTPEPKQESTLSDIVETKEEEADKKPDSADESDEQKNKNRENYERRQNQKLIKEIERLKADMEELKSAKPEPVMDTEVVAKQVQEAINKEKAATLYKANLEQAEALFNSQDYATNPDSRNEFFQLLKTDSTLKQLLAINPIDAVQLADMKFRQAKGLTPSKIHAAQLNAAKSGLANSNYKLDVKPDLSRQAEDIITSKLTPAEKRDKANELIKANFNRR